MRGCGGPFTCLIDMQSINFELKILQLFFSLILCVVLLLISLSPSRIAAGLLQIHVLLRIVLISQEGDSCH